MKIRKKILFTLALLLFFSISLLPKSLEKIPFIFDVQINKIITGNNCIQLTPKDNFSNEKGFGWIINPVDGFTRDKLIKSTFRDYLTIDGCVGTEIKFKANIPAGEWYFTLWMEAGLEDSNTAKLFVNNNEQKIKWHNFHPPAEGRTNIQSIYRVYRSEYSLSKEGFEFSLTGIKDSVRILGFSLIPEPEIDNPEKETLFNLIKLAGKYKSVVGLSDIAAKLEYLYESDSNDSFYAYWLEQISILSEAERLKNMMGWEWARLLTGYSIFTRLHQAVMLLDGIIESVDPDSNPLLERALWDRGKILYDLHLERGGRYADEDSKRDLQRIYRTYPDDPVLQMLNGKKVNILDPCDNLPMVDNAPQWAILQREAFCRLKNEIDWWVNKRQAPNGELGGKIGDDVEILRWWSPFLLLGDRVTQTGWQKLAQAVWNDPKVYAGYSSKILDVEHAAEFISDSFPELILIDNDSIYYKSLLFTAEHFRDLWSLKTPHGRLFKSSWYSSTEIDIRPPRDRDSDYNARALKPLRYLAWYTRDDQFIKLLEEWSSAWLYAALSTEKGKPKGIIPSSIRASDFSINGDEPTWFKANMFWPYFDWERGNGGKILDQLLFTYTLTGNDSLLLPIELSLDLIYDNIESYNRNENNNPIAGSTEWIIKNLLTSHSFWSVVGRWRLITNNTKYDWLLEEYASTYTSYRLSKDENVLTSGLYTLLEDIRYNTPLRTDLVVHTDRVRTPGSLVLKGMLTGDDTPEASSPYLSVSWENTGDNFTALVKESSSSSLQIELFSFADTLEFPSFRIWQLEKGEYNYRQIASGKTLKQNIITVKESGSRINLELSPKSLTEIVFEKL